MSIVIKNMGETHPDLPYDRGGERDYSVFISGEVIARFTHFRRDGLAVCMEKAAKAVADKKLPLQL